MKKILAGVFYRLIKGYEFWALIVLVLISAFFLNYVQLSSDPVIAFSQIGSEDTDINADNIDDYRFSGLGISAHDLYRAESEVLPEDVFNRIYGTVNYSTTEVWTVFSVLCGLHSFPIILIIIFIPLFFGRLFSDGTIKNLMASGHSKGKIYLSSLFVMVAIDLIIILINIAALALLCLYFKWTPPIYWPVVLTMILIELLSIITVSALCIAALFISMKKTAAFIVSFVIGIMSFVPVSSMAAQTIYYYEWRFDQQSVDYEIYAESYKPENWNRLESRIDVIEFREVFYFDGRELSLFQNIKMPRVAKTLTLATIYLDPFMIADFRDSAVFGQYSMYRDGLMAINVGSNIFWTVLSTACGIVIFRKREIR